MQCFAFQYVNILFPLNFSRQKTLLSLYSLKLHFYEVKNLKMLVIREENCSTN